LKTGKISGRQNARGHWEVDASELARIYEPRKALPGKSTDDFATPHAPETVNAHSEALAEIRVLQAELKAERQARELVERHLEDVRKMLDRPETRPKQITTRRWWPF